MKSIDKLAAQPAGLPIVADEIVELHAARLLLLCRFSGSANRIKGLTKLAKLDFFVRYPDFFTEVAAHLGKNAHARTRAIESGMVRFHYGPWDPRYYHVLGYLEGKDLLRIRKDGTAYTFELTTKGIAAAKRLGDAKSFTGLVGQMKSVKKVLGGKSGSALKKLIYDVFDEEVTNRPLGEVIGS